MFAGFQRIHSTGMGEGLLIRPIEISFLQEYGENGNTEGDICAKLRGTTRFTDLDNLYNSECFFNPDELQQQKIIGLRYDMYPCLTMEQKIAGDPVMEFRCSHLGSRSLARHGPKGLSLNSPSSCVAAQRTLGERDTLNPWW